MSEEELRSAAYEGLCAAALRYVGGKGSFERYAGIWARREIFRRIAAGEGPVSRPRNAVERARVLRAHREQLAQERCSEISDEQLAEELEAPEPRPHQKQRPETPGEIRQLEGLLNLASCELLPDDPLLSWEPESEPSLPPMSRLLRRVLEGDSIAEIAGENPEDRAEVRDRLARELRRFFSR